MDQQSNQDKVAASKAGKMVSPGRAKAAGVGLVLLLSVSLGFLGGWLGSMSNQQVGNGNTEQARQVVTEQGELISAIAEDVGPSVVSVNVTSRAQADPFFGGTYEQQSAGTGFIVSDDGYVVTNRHVIPDGTRKVSLVMSDGTELTDVEVIGKTSDSDPLDIAFLKINDAKGKDLKAVKLGDSSAMQVGEMVVAIGNALGQFQNTVTSGILSGYGRSVEASGGAGSVETLQNLFQTDAAINQGNSGGPLVNAKGEVIGVNTAVAGNAENIGFAIPINDVKGIIDTVLKKGELLRPYLGVRYIMLTDDLAYQYNLDTTRGAYIVPGTGGRGSSIVEDSPAAAAGLQEKDIITKINDTELNEDNSLISVLGQYSVGDTITLTVVRDGQEQTVEVTLEAAPKD
jgi:S1-C subfamily serine protease